MSDPLGLPSGVVIVIPYDSSWPVLYRAERDRLDVAMESHGLSLQIEHIGSTSVPGLAAKPVLDIMIGHGECDPLARAIGALANSGYVHRGPQGIPEREFFRLGNPRRMHVHLTLAGGMFWNDQLAFRDHLRGNVRAREEYARLKYELAARFPTDREAYIEGKGAWVQSILAGLSGSSRIFNEAV
jgi:GrpB-like predicted nucleotidyltransferase (UPF0157 family)